MLQSLVVLETDVVYVFGLGLGLGFDLIFHLF